ncbi:MAG: anhydro-N-acetylmuramic acid kinase [Alphaproteobacteria bacterium]|nr:anhydro-N-acetylmuramic acid kinase [Alphaproteobacteria bacterium]
MKTIGIMTGNSLDGADAVLTEFSNDKIVDIIGTSINLDKSYKENVLKFRQMLKDNTFDCKNYKQSALLQNIVDELTKANIKVVKDLLSKSKTNADEVIAIGLHGQTCDHLPPSISKDKKPYSLQVFDALKLANETNIPVIYDFRSDDILNGGEGAPLAPMHNAHISKDLSKKIFGPVSFINAGNTGNITYINKDEVLGFDIGPFNHFTDMLMRKYIDQDCDFNGEFGKKGKIDLDFLRVLFNTCAKTKDNKNFYLVNPPRSSDPTWYKLPDSIPEIHDAVRTVEYLAVYSIFLSLDFIKSDLPSTYLTFGGGWKNPICENDFINLLNKKEMPILEEHKEIFDRIYKRLQNNIIVCDSEKYGYSGKYMEARIFADLAYCKINQIPFTNNKITGAKSPTIAGIYVLPNKNKEFEIQKYLNDPQKDPLIVSRSWINSVFNGG